MNRRVVLVGIVAAGLMASSLRADWSVSDKGNWPQSWPKELEPLRKQAGTIQGSQADLVIHHIPFTKREEFEAAWLHLLKIKTKGAPVVLVKSPASHWHFGKTTAGVLIHCPPGGADPEKAVGPLARQGDIQSRWMWTTYIELVVDDQVVDLNRIKLPDDGPVIDQRFEKQP